MLQERRVLGNAPRLRGCRGPMSTPPTPRRVRHAGRAGCDAAIRAKIKCTKSSIPRVVSQARDGTGRHGRGDPHAKASILITACASINMCAQRQCRTVVTPLGTALIHTHGSTAMTPDENDSERVYAGTVTDSARA